MKTLARISTSFLLVSLLSASVACTGRVLDVGTANPAAAAANPGDPDAEPTLPDGVLARIEGKVGAIAVDATRVYLAGEGRIYTVAKTGGVVQDFSSEPEGTSSDMIAVDDGYVYASTGLRSVVRFPKAGGPAEQLAGGLAYPKGMAIDATHVYVAIEESFFAGSPPGPAIVRVPKTGGAVELVAGAQPHVTSLLLDGDDVYFAAGYHDPNGSIRRVRKTGGEVAVLAPIDARSLDGSPQVGSLARFGEKLAFVEPVSGTLTFVPRAGGAVERTALAVDQGGLVSDGDALVVGTLDTSTWNASLLRVDGRGTMQATLARWSFPAPQNVMASVGPVQAMTRDGDRVYWVDFDNHTASTTKPIVSTVRVAPAR